MGALFIWLTMGIIVAFLSWSWINGIDKALQDYPDYRGEDMLDEKPKQDWDDNKQHTEQDV